MASKVTGEIGENALEEEALDGISRKQNPLTWPWLEKLPVSARRNRLREGSELGGHYYRLPAFLAL